ncbi:DUF2213 domain-containing protein [uncultured Tissierella sp.]|uniref:DUF2213 domain-containing protein n=1 Tax=uncultured Tissierella sp. TaxID=448160 RepID=UPI002805CD21|nr:DUF2213 domain-containing protein [uncultured Tissierella sp.]MDU5080239.1 DUF2213 domain-containing protein [Bacillota bacterium]
MSLKEGNSQEIISQNIKKLEVGGMPYSQALAIAISKAGKNNKDVKYAGKAFYGSRLSNNITKTPEGYLVCQNVPLSRTGMQEYLGQELNLEGEYFDQIVQVYRREEDVFDPNALASFEGKPVTNEHPSDEVRIDNYTSYAKGHAQNVRRGTGEDSDKMIGDLMICDPTLISEIERGKREISCGYDCVYILGEDGNFYQTSIRGNHVAVVTAGRAGADVAIKDNKPQIKNGRSKKTMAKKNEKTSIFAKMLKAFAMDAEVEEIADAIEAMNGSKEDEEIKPKDNEVKTNQDIHSETKEEDFYKTVVQTLEQMKNDIAELKAGKTVDEEDPLAKLEKELLSDNELTDEEEVTVSAEEIDEDLSMSDEEVEDEETIDEDGSIVSPAALPQNPIPGADKAALLNHIKSMKPIIAQIKDAKERKRVSDAFAKSIRQQMGVKSTQPGGYGTILQTKKRAASTKLKDAKVEDESQLGKDIAKKYNPHYKEK